MHDGRRRFVQYVHCQQTSTSHDPCVYFNINSLWRPFKRKGNDVVSYLKLLGVFREFTGRAPVRTNTKRPYLKEPVVFVFVDIWTSNAFCCLPFRGDTRIIIRFQTLWKRIVSTTDEPFTSLWYHWCMSFAHYWSMVSPIIWISTLVPERSD